MSVRRTSPVVTSGGKGTSASVGSEGGREVDVVTLVVVRARFEARLEDERECALRLFLLPLGRPTGFGIVVTVSGAITGPDG